MARKKFLLISLAMFCFVMICFLWMQSLAYGQGVHEIRAEIQKKGARWQAGDNPLSRLSFADRQKRLVLVRPGGPGRALHHPGDLLPNDRGEQECGSSNLFP